PAPQLPRSRYRPRPAPGAARGAHRGGSGNPHRRLAATGPPRAAIPPRSIPLQLRTVRIIKGRRSNLEAYGWKASAASSDPRRVPGPTPTGTAHGEARLLSPAG